MAKLVVVACVCVIKRRKGKQIKRENQNYVRDKITMKIGHDNDIEIYEYILYVPVLHQ